MAVIDISPYSGEHCESTALLNMLRNHDVELSEPLIFGLGQGLSFLYWHSKQMPNPFLAGRVKPDHLMRNVADALGLELLAGETTSPAKAEATLIAALDEGDVVGLKLDRYHLDYARENHHFAAHYVACIGYEDDRFVVVETRSLGVQSTSRESLARARSARGPMSSRNLSVRVRPRGYDESVLAKACQSSILATAQEFLSPPITNMGFKGIAKAGSLMRGWHDRLERPLEAMGAVGTSMEEGGTGGGLFRTLWAQFLEEAYELTGIEVYDELAVEYRRISKRWTDVANLLRDADDAAARRSLDEAASIVDALAAEERTAMVRLEEASR
ncbi:BtrH N-terminal domain-containing protein [Streptomyces tirandamycinicus]|uniref:BtrH N-terminal domain-containing protein n=1 Tax=Streptomyces TaxID=1883 RepID=UPI001480A459|nr:BtrH N-terminal domain-containing protein [Streptomyces sp. PKU-MA01144]NNJ03660.1 BtrH N-terminal domain-containing protein [Streptomyces sp. PKU-MA01144]